jgi:hypothetical protein
MTRHAELIDSLEHAPRQGVAVDDPEGARYVVISDTALNLIIRELRKGRAERPEAEYFESSVSECNDARSVQVDS